jgi:hypothetical protein
MRVAILDYPLVAKDDRVRFAILAGSFLAKSAPPVRARVAHPGEYRARLVTIESSNGN